MQKIILVCILGALIILISCSPSSNIFVDPDKPDKVVSYKKLVFAERFGNKLVIYRIYDDELDTYCYVYSNIFCMKSESTPEKEINNQKGETR